MRISKNQAYVKIQDLYICMDKNYILLTWLLFFRTKPFNYHATPHIRLLRVLPNQIIKVLRVFISILKLVLLKHFWLGKEKEILEVPYDGHILIKTSGGYKVFNLKNKVVATQYKSDLKTEIFNGIVRNYKIIENLGISPKIIAVDYENKCVYEEYINQYKAERFYPISSYFYEEIFPLWEQYVMNYPLKQDNLKDYIARQKFFVIDKIKQLKEKGYDKETLEKISNFVEHTYTEILMSNKQKDIYITLSHGDFHAWNILLAKNKSILIDWDTSKERSVYHDIFYMLFHNVFGNKQIDYQEFLVEMDKYINKISSKFLSINKIFGINKMSIMNMDLYRKVFYLEYVLLDFEKRLELSEERTSISRRLVKIAECIDTFKDIERNVQKNYDNTIDTPKYINFSEEKGTVPQEF